MKNQKVYLIQKILFIIACVAFVFGFIISLGASKIKSYEKAAKKNEISITDKSNIEVVSNYITCNFDFTFKNNSKKEISRIIGTMTIKDKNDKVLSYGTASFTGEFSPKSELTFDLDWRMSYDEDAIEVWNTEFELLYISFEITEIYSDYTPYEVKVDKYEKLYDSNYFENTYNQAKYFYQNKQYKEAIELFEKISDYKDSQAQLELSIYQYEIQTIASSDTYDIVTFGKYEQDYNFYNGEEQLEWIVLAKEGNKVLLMTKYAIENIAYDTDTTDKIYTWEKSTLRQWLNSNFLNSSFNNNEISIIENTNIMPSQLEILSGGNITTDKVFILSADELNQYFQTNSYLACQLTDYAYKLNYWWDFYAYWVRTPAEENSEYFQYVDGDGYISDYEGIEVDEKLAIRPAIWVTIG